MKSGLKAARKVLVFAVAFVTAFYVADRWMTPKSLADEVPAATAAVPDDVKAVLERAKAWTHAAPRQLEGEVTIDFDVAGMQESKTASFKSYFQSASALRHEAEDLWIVVGNGASSMYDPNAKQYLATTQPADAEPGDDLKMLLRQQNPALFMALTEDVGSAFASEGSGFKALEPITQEGKTFDRVEVSGDEGRTVVWVETKTGAVDRVETDYSEMLKQNGAADVKRATLTIRYTKATSPEALDPSLFVFTPPADATEIKAPAPGEMLNADGPSALEGKPAPAFTLKTFTGEEVSVSEKGGNVVVLDFWATWCPPCREGLPHLAEVAKTFADRGVKVYAINVQEEGEKVMDFLAQQKLELVAPLDADGAVSRQYGVSGIPQTVVIGADGKVRKVFVGFSKETAGELDKAVEDALKAAAKAE